MRGKLFIVIFLVLLLVPTLAAAAKNVVFITGKDVCHLQSCSCLATEEAAFCTRLSSTLGYNVTIVHESFVMANDTSQWLPWVNDANLIFVGNTTTRTTNTTDDRNIFCGNITLVTPSRKVFLTFNNVFQNRTNVIGCAFGSPLSMADWSWVESETNNTCKPVGFQKLNEGYVTAGMSANPTLYSTLSSVKMNNADGSLSNWMGAICTEPTGAFSVVSTSDKGAFWGLDKPSLFTADAWSLFDRTVWDVLGDTGFNVSVYVIPNNATINGSIMIISKVTEHGQLIGTNNTVNFTASEISGNLAYQDGFWKNTTTLLSSAGPYVVNVTAWDPYMLRGFSTQSVTAGNLTVSILSGDYLPGLDYTIIANVTNGTRFQPASVYFSIWNATNWTKIVSNQVMAKPDTYYTGTILGSGTSGWRGPLLIEVNAVNNTFYSGGTYKYITFAAPLTGILAADKTTYKPTDIANISLVVPYPPEITAANLTIVDPKGVSAPLGAMSHYNMTLWTLNYTLPPDSLNGTYTLISNFTDGIRKNSTTTSIAVKAYDAYVDKNKEVYQTNESVLITVRIANPFTTAINFTIVANITDPVGNTAIINSTNMTGAGSWNTTWAVPSTAAAGNYSISATITDNVSSTRSTKVSTVFLINPNITNISQTTQDWLSVNPMSLVATTVADKSWDEEFALTNIGTKNLTNITTSVGSEIEDIVSVAQKPTVIEADGYETLVVSVDTADLDAGVYSGMININSSAGAADIEVNIKIVGDLGAEASSLEAQLNTLSANITALRNKGKDTSSVEDLVLTASGAITDARTAWEDEDYETADAKISAAQTTIDDIRSGITGLATAATSPKKTSGIIWTVAAVVVIVIVGVMVFKFRNQLKPAMQKFLKRKPKQPEKYEPEAQPQEQPAEEEGESRYRTEWY